MQNYESKKGIGSRNESLSPSKTYSKKGFILRCSERTGGALCLFLSRQLRTPPVHANQRQSRLCRWHWFVLSMKSLSYCRCYLFLTYETALKENYSRSRCSLLFSFKFRSTESRWDSNRRGTIRQPPLLVEALGKGQPSQYQRQPGSELGQVQNHRATKLAGTHKNHQAQFLPPHSTTQNANPTPGSTAQRLPELQHRGYVPTALGKRGGEESGKSFR